MLSGPTPRKEPEKGRFMACRHFPFPQIQTLTWEVSKHRAGKWA